MTPSSLLLLAALHGFPAVETTPAEGDRLRVAAVGDVNFGSAWPEARAAVPPGVDAPFAGFKEVLSGADATIGNLETVLADSGSSSKCRPDSKPGTCFAFRAPTRFAEGLAHAGFDAVSIANNHAGDFGAPGRKATVAALDAAGVRHSGLIGDLATWEQGGVKYAFLGASFGSETYRIQEIGPLQKVVAALAEKADIVIVEFHAGAEGKGAEHVPKGVEKFLGENRGDSRAFARAMVDAGADLVLGAGPHQVRGMERYRGRLIAYSLGNFSGWSTFSLAGPGGITCVLEAEVAKNGVLTALTLHPGFIREPGLPEPDPKGRAIEAVRRLSKEDFGDALLDAQGRWSLAK